MNTEFEQPDLRLLCLHFATDEAFQQHILDVPPETEKGWHPIHEMPYLLIWRAIDNILTSAGKPGRVNSTAIRSRMSADPNATPVLNSGNMLALNEVNHILNTIDSYAVNGGHQQAVVVLKRWLHVRIALAAANKFQGDSMPEQASFLQDQLAAVQITPHAGQLDLSSILSDKIRIEDYYVAAPVQIRQLTCLLAALNSKINTATHFFTAKAMINSLLGKTLAGSNKGTKNYSPFWYVGLVKTGKGKTAIIDKIDEAIETELARWEYDTPSHTITNSFTVPFLFAQMGDSVSTKKWGNMSDQGRAKKQQRMREEAKTRPGRVMLSDEFGQNLAKLLDSGSDSGELGNILKLADSGGEVHGDVVYGGKRLISDVCLGIVAFSQPEVWAEKFDPDVHLASGLAGRFMVTNEDDFDLNIPGIQPMSSPAVVNGIRLVIRGLLNRVKRVADRVICEQTGDNDEYGEVFDELLEDPVIKEVVEFGYIDAVRLRGKLINLAIKWTMVDVFLGLDDAGLDALKGDVEAVDEADTPKPPPSTSIDGTDDVDGWEAPKPPTVARTDTLFDRATYKRNLRLVLIAAIRSFNLTGLATELTALQDRVIRNMRRSKGNKMSTGRLTQLSLKINGRPLSPYDLEQRVMGPLVDDGRVAKADGRRGTPVYTLTSDGLRRYK